jgi:hypothetical protein
LDICVTFWQKAYLHFVHALRLCRRLEYKGFGLLYVVEISRQHTISGCGVGILAALSQTYNEKRNTCKAGVKEGGVEEEAKSFALVGQ